MSTCIALLGGSFDPVHHGHVALARLFCALLKPTALHVMPAKPWQKSSLQASDAERVAMLELAFRELGEEVPVVIDQREIERGTSTYTVETLRGLRAEFGPEASIVFLMGADQLQNLDSWREWRELFALANIAVAARPGYTLEQDALPQAVAEELAPRLAPPEQVRIKPAGLVCLAHTLAVDISATRVRALLRKEGEPQDGPRTDVNSLVAPVVLDYIQQHHLYKN
ncbi:nicotinate-nucleotide adenylyltransferase [Massilia sp. Leaf139]|uniref:nicotinate-nucleotide adenylyltransferase n=1 Tax=Massilia sp. Leaf139 TaxID=1736272 RepID=UPI0007008FE4|nr:nicotinate-nucleotide adenylyltransferase [Massilia sp. Leaf139]KQQ87796.1 nicotinate-nicotinamide nucleotide adenylyltransferase [Massilia sp. Leaf139]